MHIRRETPEDVAEIRSLTNDAFRNAAYSSGKEGEIVDALRAAKALTLSLIAEEDRRILGHVAFSPVLIDGEDKGWYGLGPVSVCPDRQGEGIGGKLIREGSRSCAASALKAASFWVIPAITGASASRPMSG